MSNKSHTPDEALKEKISGYIEAAYLHGLPTEDMDTGEMEPPADIADVAWITDSVLHLIASEVVEKERTAYEKGVNDLMGTILQRQLATAKELGIEIASLTTPNDNKRKG